MVLVTDDKQCVACALSMIVLLLADYEVVDMLLFSEISPEHAARLSQLERMLSSALTSFSCSCFNFRNTAPKTLARCQIALLRPLKRLN